MSTAEAAIDAALARAERVQIVLNPFTTLLHEHARATARALDRLPPEQHGLLHGVPVVIKDLTPSRGHLTALGSHTTGEAIATRDAVIVQRLRAAGAVLIGKTTTPEFAFSGFTRSPRFGVTRNPYDPARSAGGSSGGSGVAVASGVVDLAEGTDMGGSVRIPAAFCGVVGLKPSRGRIPMDILPSGFDLLSHFGPLARSVEHAVRFMAAVAGEDASDIFSLPLPFDLAATAARPAGTLRLAFSADLGAYAVDPAVAATIAAALDSLRGAGISVTDVSIPWTAAVPEAWGVLWDVFHAALNGDARDRAGDVMDPAVVAMIDRGRTHRAADVKRIEILQTRMMADLAGVLAAHDALLCPTCAIPPPPITEADADYERVLPDGRYRGLDMCGPFNMVPVHSALSLPAGLTPDGLPVGLQIVGRRHRDEALLGVARTLEGVLGKLPAPPMIGSAGA